MIEEDLEEASGGGDREDCSIQGILLLQTKVGRWSASNCRRNEVNLAISAKGTTPNKKLNNCYHYRSMWPSYIILIDFWLRPSS